jgi:hypothetical protein
MADHAKSLPRVLVATLPLVALAVSSPAMAANGLCKPLRAFAASVKPDEEHVIKFKTIWGGGFKGSDPDTLSEKACDHNAYEPARAVCAYLMESGAVEFSGLNAMSAIECLSPRTRFAKGRLHSIAYSVSFGTDDRGAQMDIDYSWDEQLGAMVLSIKANGY